MQNYIDDTGVQLCDLVVGFQVLREMDLAAVRQRYEQRDEAGRLQERFDYVAWDLYAEVTRFYEADEANRKHREAVLHAVESGDNPTAELGAYLARRMVQHHLTTMRRLDVEYDVLPHESDILRLRFWDRAFDLLKQSGAVHQASEGKNAGCWVMDLPGVEGGAGEDQKVIVRSNGTVTYVGKDIAYQMWKFGLLGCDFRYEQMDWSPLESLYPVWSTHSGENQPGHPAFGGGGVVYNVIDTRQSYLQRVVALGLQGMGYTGEAERSVHFAYEMVALTPDTVLALFPDYPMSDEERGKQYLEMSGRKGLGVRADDLLDALLPRAAAKVRERNADFNETQIAQAADAVAIAALRYYMLRFSKNRVVAFDLDSAIAFEGETGPYIQYAVVRAKNVLRHVADAGGAVDAAALVEQANLDAVAESDRPEHWGLIQQLLRVPQVLQQAVETLELAMVAKHAYVLAQAFNSFYHRYKVSQEPDEATRAARIGVVRAYHDGMIDLLSLMGIRVPERM